MTWNLKYTHQILTLLLQKSIDPFLRNPNCIRAQAYISANRRKTKSLIVPFFRISNETANWC